MKHPEVGEAGAAQIQGAVGQITEDHTCLDHLLVLGHCYLWASELDI